MFLVVSGNMGTGKTTLTRLLARELSATAHYESVDDNPFLERTWRDRGRWGFALQAYYLAHRFETHRRIQERILASGGRETHIQDRSIYEGSEVFVEYLREGGFLDPDEYRTYRMLHEGLVSSLQPPDLVLYLRCPLARIQAQVAARDRGFERKAAPEMLQALNDRYEQWYESYSRGPKLALEAGLLEFSDPTGAPGPALPEILRRIRANT